MPDLHQGYSLPIGGVVALDHAVSPAFVGYDIACQMKLTILAYGKFAPEDLEEEAVRIQFLEWMLKSTSFGLGSTTSNLDHAVMHDYLWDELPILRDLKPLVQRFKD